jgi:hypothetical protein
MARTHRCPGWLGTAPRIAVSCQAMAPHNRPVSPSAITDNPGSVSIATGQRDLGGVTGLTQQCLDQEVDPAAASGTPHRTADAQDLAARCAVRSERVQRREPSGIS